MDWHPGLRREVLLEVLPDPDLNLLSEPRVPRTSGSWNFPCDLAVVQLTKTCTKSTSHTLISTDLHYKNSMLRTFPRTFLSHKLRVRNVGPHRSKTPAWNPLMIEAKIPRIETVLILLFLAFFFCNYDVRIGWGVTLVMKCFSVEDLIPSIPSCLLRRGESIWDEIYLPHRQYWIILIVYTSMYVLALYSIPPLASALVSL